MSANLHAQKRPRAWAIEDDGEVLRIGTRRIAAGDIVGFEASRVTEPNVTGHLLAVGMFFAIGCLFVMPVAMSLARPKFLLGGVLFLGIGLTAIGEIRRSRGIRLHCVDVLLASGETVRFTAAEPSEAFALADVLSPLARG